MFSKPDLTDNDRIVFVATWGIGDTLLLLPTIQALRKSYPALHITLVTTHPELRPLLRTFVEDLVIHETRGKQGLLTLLFLLRANNYHAAILERNNSLLIKYALKAIAGISTVCGGERLPFSGQPTDRSHKALSTFQSVKKLFPLIHFAEPRLDLPPNETQWAAGYWREHFPHNRPVVFMHLGSGFKQTYKRIPNELVESILLTVQRCNGDVLILQGPQDPGVSRELIDRFRDRLRVQSGLSLTQVAALLQKGVATVAGDTSIGHLSSLVGTPVLTLAGPTLISMTKPLGEKNVVLELSQLLSCQPCHGLKRSMDCTTFECMKTIPVNRIEAVIRGIMTGATPDT